MIQYEKIYVTHYSPLADRKKRLEEFFNKKATGNRILKSPCTFCPYKFKCRSDSNDGAGLRVFTYAKGPVYLTKVIKEPNVEEVL